MKHCSDQKQSSDYKNSCWNRGGPRQWTLQAESSVKLAPYGNVKISLLLRPKDIPYQEEKELLTKNWLVLIGEYFCNNISKLESKK